MVKETVYAVIELLAMFSFWLNKTKTFLNIDLNSLLMLISGYFGPSR